MWVLTSFAAFMPALRPPETVAPGDEQVIQIRARRRVDLKRLRDYYMADMGPTYVIDGSDYEFRANCTRADLACALVKISLDIDYVSFKDTTTTVWGDGQLHDTYMRVWNAIFVGLGNRNRRARGGGWGGRHRGRPKRQWWEDIEESRVAGEVEA